jgi:hypothetical protein
MRKSRLQQSILVLISAAAIVPLALGWSALAQPNASKDSTVLSYKITKEVPLPGPDRWDFIKYSRINKRESSTFREEGSNQPSSLWLA